MTIEKEFFRNLMEVFTSGDKRDEYSPLIKHTLGNLSYAQLNAMAERAGI